MISELETIKTIELEVGKVSLKSNDILYIDYAADVDIDETNIHTVAEAIIELCDCQPRLFIIDVRECYGNYSNKARDYMAKDPAINKLRKAFAILTNSAGTRILANFYLKMHKPLSPGKLFKDEKSALDWLNNFK